MCRVNDDCPAEGRERMDGRICRECNHMAARCANCGNEWAQDASEPHPHNCPECGRH